MKHLLRTLVSLGLIAYLLTSLDAEAIGGHLAGIDALSLVGAVGLTLCAVAMRAYRWALVLSVYRVRLGFRNSFELIQIGNFYGQFLPTTVGGDVVRAWQAHRLGLPMKETIHTVLLDRLFGFVSLLILIAAAVPVLGGMGLEPAAVTSLAIASAVGLGATVAVLAFDLLLRGFRDRELIGRICEFSTGARRLAASHRASIPALLASLCIVGLSVGAIALLARGVGASVGYMQLLALTPPVMLVAMLPFSLAGWGVREGAMVYALGHVGVTQEQAMAIAILTGLVQLLVSLTGAMPALDARSRAPDGDSNKLSP